MLEKLRQKGRSVMRFFDRLLVSALFIGVLGFTVWCSDSVSKTDSSVIDESETFREDIAVEEEEIYQEEVVTIKERFQLDSVSVTLQVDIPDGWNYFKWDVEQEVPDWGLQIQIGDHENSIIMISGQHGTLNVSGLYPDPPEIFITNQGTEATYYKNEFEMDDGEIYVNQQIVIGQMKSGFYGISLQMPKTIYDDHIESIRKVLESVKIAENDGI